MRGRSSAVPAEGEGTRYQGGLSRGLEVVTDAGRGEEDGHISPRMQLDDEPAISQAQEVTADASALSHEMEVDVEP